MKIADIILNYVYSHVYCCRISYGYFLCCTTPSGSRRPDRVEFHFITMLILLEILTDYLSEADSFSLRSGGKRFSVAEFAD